MPTDRDVVTRLRERFQTPQAPVDCGLGFPIPTVSILLADVELVAEVQQAIERERAEGYRAGVERAAAWVADWCTRSGPYLSAAIRALAPVPDSTAEPGWEPRDPRPWIRDILDGAVESIARQVEAGPTGAKATDPRGSDLRGGEALRCACGAYKLDSKTWSVQDGDAYHYFDYCAFDGGKVHVERVSA